MSRPTRRPTRSAQRTAPPAPTSRSAPGPTQRQLRAGELVRHALVEILREEALLDPALEGVSVTLTEVRMSPDLRNALCFIVPLGGEKTQEVVAALNRASRFLRGHLGHAVELRFTPDIKFVADESFDEAARMRQLFDDPKVRRDLEAPARAEDGADSDAPDSDAPDSDDGT
jgi:ribosome-binding factor A